ncbi:hypothetical protein PLESTB_001655900 [Pleodorina starrii]|uniref:Uncharacterized protein n=1 Tax=Pleodorina starrii TaxID=330485 RepID=A0A9W6BYN4_9CHLO|nr:hypothetical protein PLESTB_001655900 [Pleodorina starrii]
MSALSIWGDYLPVVQTGLQTLCIIAAGRLAASRGLFDPAPVCRTLNRFVVVACLPALQFWLLAIKTDMRNMEHWRAVGAFMLWTLLVQIACTTWVLLFEGGKLSRICVHSLVLAANNTGILAPVVLEAAVGPSAAAVGMLATIVLYFQQLPVAMVLFELDRMTEGREGSRSSSRGSDDVESEGKAGAWDAAGGAGGGDADSREPRVGAAREGGLWAVLQPQPQPQQRDGSPASVAAATSGEAATWSTPPGAVSVKLLSSHRSTDLHRGPAAAGGWSGRSLSQRGLMVSPVAAAAASPAGGKAAAEAGGGSGNGCRAGGRNGRRWDAKTAPCVWTAAAGDDAAAARIKDGHGAHASSTAAAAIAAIAAIADGDGDGAGDVDSAAGARTGRHRTAGIPTPPTPAGCGGDGDGLPSHPHHPHHHHHHHTEDHLRQPSVDALRPDSAPRYRSPHHDWEVLRQRSQELPLDLAAAAATTAASPYTAAASSAWYPSDAAAAAAAAGGGGGGGGAAAGSDEPSLRHAAQLVLGNALMWTTGAATAVSMLGLHSILDPEVPSHLPELGFVEGTLSWLARCSVPVSLFAMGLFTASRPACGGEGASVRTLVGYLAVKLLVLPWLMVFVNSLMGLDGRLARSLVVLTCVPVGQNAFLVTEQYGEGAEAVTGVMQAGLGLMLPHVAAVMAALRWLGLYQGAVA